MIKKLRNFLLLLAGLVLLPSSVLAASVWSGDTAKTFAGGIGSSDDPYLIANGAQLMKLAADVKNGTTYEGYFFKLSADIVLNSNVLSNGDLNTGTYKEWPGIGQYNTDTDIFPFSGTFDGNGYTIAGIYISNYSQYTGLFRYLVGATVKNVGIIDSYNSGNANIGLLAGGALNSRILNCYNAGTIAGTGSYHGGLVGVSMGTTLIANCYNTGRVGGKNNLGGIVARNGVNALYQCRVENCYNTGSFVATKTNIGGITAENCAGCTVTDCYYLTDNSTAGVYTNSGTSTNVNGKSASDFAASSLLSSLNTLSQSIAGACRWKASTSSPVFDFSSATADITSSFNVFTMASIPSPADGEIRAPADGNRIVLSWTPAAYGNTVKHYVYLSTDSAALAATATGASTNLIAAVTAPTSSYTYKGDLYCMQTYYWRVDEESTDGTVTKGMIWSFRPRHLAFPEADGYGKYAIGGRGGKVVYVTNLNDSGEGSFREAITNDIGPRTIVFNVSGVIKLASRLTCSSKYVTVAAQTAPGRGICFAAAPVGVASDNIFRFLRVRVGSGETYDGMGMASNQNSITDHCSISWTIDESFSSRNAKDITLQRTLISEALNIAGHKNYPEGTGHGYAATIGGDIGSFHHNLLAHNEGRNFSMGGGLDGNTYYAGRLDIFNNVVYNFNGRVTDGGAHEVNFVGNYYKKGAASVLDYTLCADLEGTGLGTQSYYYHNNILQNTDGSYSCDGTCDTCGRIYKISNGQILNWNLWHDEPFFESRATIHTARNAYKNVLSDVGASQPVLDDHDQRMVKESLNGTYSCTGSKSQLGGIIDANSESLEGDYSYYTSETRPDGFDSDWDGLPDWWEKMTGTNPNSASGDYSDGAIDANRDGYTNLEDYLDYMSIPHVETEKGGTVSFTMSEHFMGYTKTTPVYIVAEKDAALNITLKGETVQVTSDKAGIFYFKMKVVDAQGDEMTRRFAVYFSGSNIQTYVYASEAADLWTNAEKWTPSYVPTATDTTIIRQGEVKAAGLNQSVPVIVEKDGTFRLTADCTLDSLIMQGGTLKSYTSNPLFTLTANVAVEEDAVCMVGSTVNSEFDIKGSISGKGNIEKTSVGVLNLLADATAYTGIWTVSGGSLKVSAENAIGQGGVTVLDADTLIIEKENTTASLSLSATSVLKLDADLYVETAEIGGMALVAGTYTSADYPDIIKGNGKLIVSTGTTHVEDWAATEISIAPNPVTDEAVISLPTSMQSVSVKLFNSVGAIMFEEISNETSKFTVSMSNIPSGVYYVQLTTLDKVFHVKIIKR